MANPTFDMMVPMRDAHNNWVNRLVHYPEKDFPAGVTGTPEEDIFYYLYDQYLDEYRPQNGNYVRSQPKSGPYVPRSRLGDRVAYEAELAALEGGGGLPVPGTFATRGVLVPQRGWGCVSRDATRSLIGTAGLALCVGTFILDRAAGVAALAHVDKDNRGETIVALIEEGVGGANPLEVYFYGGDPNIAPQGRKNILDQLKALHAWNRARGPGPSRITVVGFDVLARPHSKNVVLDAATGRFYCECPSATQGLDTAFRTWPNRRYFLNEDGSGMAVADDKVSELLRREVRRLRCVWNGGRREAMREYVAGVNELVCLMVVDAAREHAPLERQAELHRNRRVHAPVLVTLDMPLAVETAWRTWCGWRMSGTVMAAVTPDARRALLTPKARGSLVGVLDEAFQKSVPSAEKIKSLATAWFKNNKVEGEGKYFI